MHVGDKDVPLSVNLLSKVSKVWDISARLVDAPLEFLAESALTLAEAATEPCADDAAARRARLDLTNVSIFGPLTALPRVMQSVGKQKQNRMSRLMENG